jgi:hypothetical protein
MMQLVFPNPVRLANAARQQNIKPTTVLLLAAAGVGAYFLLRKPKVEEAQPMSGSEGGYSWEITQVQHPTHPYEWRVYGTGGSAAGVGLSFGGGRSDRPEVSSGNATSYQEARAFITNEILQLQTGA